MTTNPQTKTLQNPHHVFWLCLLYHTLLWTVGPVLTRPSLPHDTLEAITWGLQWQWGYHKHPLITAWLTAAVAQAFNTIDWPIYLLAQLAIAATWIAVWRLAREMLPSWHAVIATLCLDGVLFYNINSFNLTPDTLQSPLWALLALFFYQALTTQTLRYWLLTGLFATLCLLTKYQALILLLPMFLFCVTNKTARESFKQRGIYFGMFCLLLTLVPHVFWLMRHHWITLYYARDIGSAYTNNTAHLLNPLHFILSSITYVAGILLLCWPFYHRLKRQALRLYRKVWGFGFAKLDCFACGTQRRSFQSWRKCIKRCEIESKVFGKRKSKTTEIFVAPRFQSDAHLSSFQWQFILWVGLAPFVLTLFLNILSGDHYPIRWATPYFFGIGIIIMGLLKPHITHHTRKQFLMTLFLFSTSLWLIRIGGIALLPRAQSDAYLPNRTIAAMLPTLWHEKQPIPYLAGSPYLVTSLIPYMHNKPIPFLSLNQRESPWINLKDFKQRGGLLIWDIGHHYTWDAISQNMTSIPNDMMRRFPRIQYLGIYTFYRIAPQQNPIQLAIARLPPEAPF